MTRIARLLRIAGFAFAPFVWAAVPVLAQEREPSPADSSTGWIFRWINFAIVLAVIIYGFRKAAPSFRARADEIAQRIAEGTRAREAAEKQRAESQAKLAGIESEVAALRVEAKRGAEAEAQRIRALARTEAEMIERAAQAEIAAAERAARLELRTLAARLAVARAEATLRKEMTPESEAVLFGAFVAELEGRLN
jgi:F0F1-type ATP synthase membrane subunit b/b'